MDSYRYLMRFLLLVLTLLFTGCATFKNSPDAWVGPDKFHHFMLFGLISMNISASSGTDCNAAFKGIGTVISIGLTKEYYDQHIKKTYWSWKDMFWNFLGASLGSLAVTAC